MQNYIKEGTDQNPSISLNFKNGEFNFYGKSYPENVSSVYGEVLDLIEEYSSSPAKVTTLTFEWLYFNTATYNMLVHIIKTIEKIETKLIINWKCKKDFTVMIEKGKFLNKILDTQINLVMRTK